jgi:hypothetical protein
MPSPVHDAGDELVISTLIRVKFLTIDPLSVSALPQGRWPKISGGRLHRGEGVYGLVNIAANFSSWYKYCSNAIVSV